MGNDIWDEVLLGTIVGALGTVDQLMVYNGRNEDISKKPGCIIL